MGNCCSKDPSAFSSPGRPLGSTPAVGVPSAAARKVGGPPRTLGGGSGSGRTATAAADAEEARRKAAAAAEIRAQQAAKPPGPLAKKLADQRKMTHRETLEDAARQNLREREVDENAANLRNL
ncbi:hypothetical protein QBC39DRAFT_376800 [Podospora conica]|nr:hypothetical protein QBC39DRAFT_376800 [Schizothecium conicum]